jgi:hypothetical protein
LAPVKIVTVLSPFLLDVQRKVLGACQNRLLVSISSTFHSFLFEKVLVGCLNLYSIVFLLYLMVPLSSPFLL